MWLTGPLLASERVNKSKYHLFNPTPVSEMRAFSTDRPDKTESAYSVDAGHFQFETDIINYTKETDTIGINHINLKVGVLNDLEFQTIVQSYFQSKDRKGFGDIFLRTKYNLLGNEGGPLAMALMPLVKLPTNTNGFGNPDVEGGIIFLIAIPLPKSFDMGTMLQVDFKKYVELTSTATVGIPIVGSLAAYTEIFSKSSADPNEGWAATFDTGLTYQIGNNWQLDTGFNIGLTEAADDLNNFVGLSGRF